MSKFKNVTNFFTEPIFLDSKIMSTGNESKKRDDDNSRFGDKRERNDGEKRPNIRFADKLQVGSSDHRKPSYSLVPCLTVNGESWFKGRVVIDGDLLLHSVKILGSLLSQQIQAHEVDAREMRSQTGHFAHVHTGQLTIHDGTANQLLLKSLMATSAHLNQCQIETLEVTTIRHHQSSKTLQGKPNTVTTHQLVDNSTKIIYANPLHGSIVVILPGEVTDSTEITIKDISLLGSTGSMYNVEISVNEASKSQTAIEHYNNGLLVCSIGGKYILNTSGGSVTFRYIPGAWLVMQQFLGNPRLVPVF